MRGRAALIYFMGEALVTKSYKFSFHNLSRIFWLSQVKHKKKGIYIKNRIKNEGETAVPRAKLVPVDFAGREDLQGGSIYGK